jgi:hypothetical protein
MKSIYFYLIVSFIFLSSAFAQTKLWVYVHGGDVMFYNPQTMNWEPVINKQQIPEKTYVLTGPGAYFKAFKETETVEAPANAYFFLDDIFPRNKVQVVEELTLIESQQLRSTIKGDSTKQKNVLGLTYGNPLPSKTPDPGVAIPHFKERENAVNRFYEQKRYDAAILSLKRMILQFPSLYYNIKYTDLLLKLYEKLELFGFIYSETNWLMQIQKDNDFNSSMKQWNDLAKQKLTKR